jgi:hypothetical protein
LDFRIPDLLSVSEEDILLQAPVKMKAWPAAEAESEKLIDKNDIIGNYAVDRSHQISEVNPLRE